MMSSPRTTIDLTVDADDDPRQPKRIKTDLAGAYASNPTTPYRPRQVIDLTSTSSQGSLVPRPPIQTSTPAATNGATKDGRRDVVCIGQLSCNALILYPMSYICPKPGEPVPPLPATADGYVPVRLKYDDVAKRRAKNPGQSTEETIQIQVPHYKGGPSGNENLGGDEFGVVEQRFATVLGPLMQKVLIRLEAHVQRAVTQTVPILKLRILVFTPRGNVKVVAGYLTTGGVRLENPTLPYNPADHRDSPPFENPHQGPDAPGPSDYRYPGSAQQNRWSQQAVSGKSVEVQRSQVEKVFESLKSGDDLTESEAGPNVATTLYPHQKKALTFLLEREADKKFTNTNDIWTVRKDASGKVRGWYNSITQKEYPKEPVLEKGGILADDMGLGKTISIVSLMANTLEPSRLFAYGPMKKITLRVAKAQAEAPPLTAANFAAQVWGMPENAGDIDSASELDGLSSGFGSGSGGKGKKGKRETQREQLDAARMARIKVKSRATLIICPLSTIANWEDQFREHWAGEVNVVGGTSGNAPPNANLVAAANKQAELNRDRRGSGAKAIKLYVYHGSSRRPDVNFLADFDAVITTYSTLATEYSKQVKSSALYEDDAADVDARAAAEDSGSESYSDEGDSNVIKLKEKKPKKRPPGAALAAGLEVSSPLQQIHWFRVVLDEAHSIKETTTIASRASCDLMADRRWALTGTPVQNKLDDVYALIKFLRAPPFEDKGVWSEFIGGPAKFGQPLGVIRLQTVMRSLTLRRTKESTDAAGQRILNLPPRHDEVRYLKFDEEERKVYDSYYTESKAEFTDLSKAGEVLKNYVGILQKILRLRQICDHYELVKGKDEGPNENEGMLDYDSIVASIMKDGINITSATSIFNLFRESGTAQCVECGLDCAVGGTNVIDTDFDNPRITGARPKKGGGAKGSRGPTRASSPTGSRPVITKCQHLYCIECFRLSICPNWPKIRPPGPGETALHRACSVCQSDLEPLTDAIEVSPDGLISSDLAPKPRAPKKEKRQKGSALGGYNASTKVKALMGDLMEISKQNPYSMNYDPSAAADVQMTDASGNVIDDGITKIVVFSQWTSMLDKIEDALEEANIAYDRLDGTMKREDRTRAMDALKYDPKTEVLLVSLRAGGVGLNLTAARRVYLMDPYWNPAVENQAVDRIHRLGQTHAVKTIKMIMENSIEQRLLEVQARKTQLANMTLGGATMTKAELQQRRVEELHELFAG
ncbi:hypothetical protein DL93DRAFT_2123795 [Clavulina sp. PMI_390]|nr:hypothetical protein DL93DRAFT_2123795 [Clavulina sp. PMI_390]